MPFDMRVNRGESHWDTQTAPTRNEQDHLKPKRIRIMLTVARRMPQGMFPTALVSQRAIPDEIQHAISRRRKRRSVAVAMVHTTACASHWPDRSIRNVVQYFSVDGRYDWSPLSLFARIANQRYNQPTADQKVPCLGTAKMLLERVQRLIYFAWDACGTPHVSCSCAFWDVGYIQNT